MLVLDSVVPVYSRAELNAGMAVLNAKASERIYDGVGHDPTRYDPIGGAGLAAPRLQGWIIGDIDCDSHPPGEPHCYYDLTDKGRGALGHVKTAKSGWAAAASGAAAGLEGMDTLDVLEEACRLNRATPSMDAIRGDLDRLLCAWKERRGGGAAAAARTGTAVNPRDLATANLVPLAKWRGDVMGTRFDGALLVTTVMEMAHRLACKAKPATRSEDLVLRTLMKRMREACGKISRKITGTLPQEYREQADSGGNDGDLHDKKRGKNGSAWQETPQP